jgi:hypothetical protein
VPIKYLIKVTKEANQHDRLTCIYRSMLPVMTPQIYLFHYYPDLSNLNLPEYSLETFLEIYHKLLSRKYDKDHETIQAIVRYVWEHTRDVREAIAIAKIVDTSDEVNSIANTLRRYSNELRANNKRRL